MEAPCVTEDTDQRLAYRHKSIFKPSETTLEVYGGLGKLDFPKVRSPQNHLNDEPRPRQRDVRGTLYEGGCGSRCVCLRHSHHSPIGKAYVEVQVGIRTSVL